jgi:hypothetical protein
MKKSLCCMRRLTKLLSAVLLTVPISFVAASTDVPVSIHAVNYSDQEFEYTVHDPKDKSNNGGGESIGRFGAGGTMCCYSLPKKWRPEMKVKIDFNVYHPRLPDGSLPKTTSSTLADIPQYNQPQELWVVRDVEGKMTIVISNFEPDHPKWSGKVKGWPIPSLAYRRERIDIMIETARSNLEAVQNLYSGMKKTPNETAKRLWKFSEEYDQKEIIGYKGYYDKKYQQFLIEDLSKSLIDARLTLKHLEEERP